MAGQETRAEIIRRQLETLECAASIRSEHEAITLKGAAQFKDLQDLLVQDDLSASVLQAQLAEQRAMTARLLVHAREMQLALADTARTIADDQSKFAKVRGQLLHELAGLL